MCTYFSTIMNLNWKNMPPDEARRGWLEAIYHLEFAIELYRAQMEAGRLFLHEHPLSATSWGIKAMADLVNDPRTVKVAAHQCMLGLVSRGCDGIEKPCLKPTGFLTNSPEIAADS